MEYKDFINKLYIKGAGSRKVELTKNLFLSAVNETSVITDKRDSDSSYKGFNRGNSIDCIAYDAINDLNKSGIEAYIEEYFNSMHDKKSENVQKICGRFKEDIPSITPENISERIASFFVDEVLKPAAKEYEKTIQSTKDDSTRNDPVSVQETNSGESNIDNRSEGNITNKSTTINNHTEDNSVNITNTSTANINETFVSSKMDNTTLTNNNRSNTISIDLSSKSKDKLNELKALIEELSANLLNLNDKGGSNNCCSWVLSKDEREEKKQEFEKLRNEFISKNEELRYYYLSFSELKDTFEKMIHISRVVKYGVYTIITEANDVMPVCDPEITEYEECIKAVWKALSK